MKSRCLTGPILLPVGGFPCQLGKYALQSRARGFGKLSRRLRFVVPVFSVPSISNTASLSRGEEGRLGREARGH